ncbi:eukaryotic translation initiation factor 3 subunit L-like [Centruroides sculpturatus]|uniref:eukaryotic translation initiation factor 3 subunit L-like n=1 Tax=Centruroides sculpturatus TaxID=218467 RepID=UPI000C6DC87E|nr:eukaryotic translation initiation factor 3 subunit L-like [Centruroides sculpturatus]
MYEGEEYVDSEYDPYAYHMNNYDYDPHGPSYDLERQYSQTYKIPEPVCKFLVHLRKAISDGNAYETQNLYENSIRKNGPTVNQRFESYYNYCDLFNCILSAEGPVPLELPNRWLWEIIDEFIYQFQAFGHYRSMLGKKSPEEIELLRSNPKVWNVHSVLNVLHSLVDKSNINCQLEVYTSGGDPDSVAGEFGRHLLYKMLGYFSLVALLRLHSLLGDYHQAIKVLENIDLNKNSMYSRVAACQITTYYYVGFAYMMMRRYADAIRTFSNILLYIQRTRQMFQQRTYQVDQVYFTQNLLILKSMYSRVAACQITTYYYVGFAYMMMRRYADAIRTFSNILLYIQRTRQMFQQRTYQVDQVFFLIVKLKTILYFINRQLKEFETCFSFACPKFLSPVSPTYDAEIPSNYHKEPFFLQLKVFLDEVQQQIMLPNIRSYMKLYTTMPISKLAAFLAMEEEEFRTHLLCFKHKMKNMVWTKGTNGLEGEFQCGSEVDFFIDKDMVHIADTKVARRYGDFFIRQTLKFEELYHKINNLQL